MYIRAAREHDHWRVENAFGHGLLLPCAADLSGCEIPFGVLGTSTRAKVKGRKTDRMADLLASLRRPLYLIDARRNGVGGQGSWAPLEFATLIPEAMASPYPFSFVHLPCLAPSHGLVDAWHAGRIASWRELRDRYNSEVSADSIEVARAFVEAAAHAKGLAIFLCAEPDAPDFDALPLAEQNAVYCHRFALARRISERLQDVWSGARVRLLCLDIGAEPREVAI
jgi:hypothetical protein